MNRAVPRQDLLCRKCKLLPETLAHVIGQCSYTKAERIRRHNEILKLVMDKVSQKDPCAVLVKEPSLTDRGEVLKPDLVVKTGGRVLVVDVTVRHEDGNYLENGRQEKVNKYSRLLPQVKERFGASEGAVVPVVVGTWGGMPKFTIEDLKQLGIKNKSSMLTSGRRSRSSTISWNTGWGEVCPVGDFPDDAFLEGLLILTLSVSSSVHTLL